MTLVTHSVIDPASSDPVPVRSVDVELVTAVPSAHVWDRATGAEVDKVEHVDLVPTNGAYPAEFTLDLAPNSTLAPATRYRVRWTLVGEDSRVLRDPLVVEVPDQPGPLRLFDLLNAAPLAPGEPLVVGFVPAGVYDPARTYFPREVVSLNGGSWVARSVVTGVAPGTDPSRWQVVGEKGAKGDKGDPGPVFSVNGETGAVTGFAKTADLAAVAKSGSASDITTGVLADARIPDSIARDTEVTAAVSAKTTRRKQVVNVDDYVPAGTDTTATNCSPFFQAAINAAGAHGTILFSGRYRCDTELALLDYQSFQGSGQYIGANGVTANSLDFRNITANAAQGGQKCAIRSAINNKFADFVMVGPGDNVALSRGIAPPSSLTASTPRLTRVGVLSFEVGLTLVGAYYTRLYDCSFQANKTALAADACYNLNLYGVRINSASLDNTRWGSGIVCTTLVRGLFVSGGSIESYATGISIPSNSTVTLHGVYAESTVGATNCIFLDCGDGQASITAEMSGCTIYIYAHQYVARFTRPVGGTFIAHGNKYIYNRIDPNDAVAQPTYPLIYALTSPTNSTARCWGDNVADCWYSTANGNQRFAYTDNIWGSGPILGYHVTFPIYAGTSYEHRNTIELHGRSPVYPFRVVTAAATLVETDDLVIVNSAAAVTIKLSPVFGQVPGRRHVVKNIGAGTVTIAPAEASGVTVDAGATLATGQASTFVLYGGNWLLI